MRQFFYKEPTDSTHVTLYRRGCIFPLGPPTSRWCLRSLAHDAHPFFSFWLFSFVGGRVEGEALEGTVQASHQHLGGGATRYWMDQV